MAPHHPNPLPQPLLTHGPSPPQPPATTLAYTWPLTTPTPCHNPCLHMAPHHPNPLPQPLLTHGPSPPQPPATTPAYTWPLTTPTPCHNPCLHMAPHHPNPLPQPLLTHGLSPHQSSAGIWKVSPHHTPCHTHSFAGDITYLLDSLSLWQASQADCPWRAVVESSHCPVSRPLGCAGHAHLPREGGTPLGPAYDYKEVRSG